MLSYFLFLIILCHNSLFPIFSIIFGIFGHSEEDPLQGGSNFACGANYPHQALKGGCFVFVWGVGT